ncbi:hypothetical protein D3C84_1147990 [compost metagenome]
MHQVSKAGLPGGRSRDDRWCRTAHTQGQAQPDQYEHGQAEHEVQVFHQVAFDAVFGKQATQFDQGIYGRQQHQH